MNLPFYSAEDVTSAVPMNEAIEAMKRAFVALSDGSAIVPNRINLPMVDQNALHLSMPAYIKGGKYNTIKLVNVHFDNPQKGLPLINGVILVMDAVKGNPVALVEGKSVTALRTGAGSGLATDLLAKADSKNAVIFGSGAQAKTQIEAIRCVRNLESIKIIGRSKEKTEAFCNKFDDAVQPGNINDLKTADIICTATTGEIPLFDADDVKLGVHINAVGAHKPDTRELGTKLIRNGKVYIDQLSSSKEEAGDILIPISEGHYNWGQIEGELGNLVSGKISGRETANDIIIFNSIGNAVQDLVIAETVIEKNEK
ncbi:MAG: ornithine cyclodeaminase family protein [Candidatus Marinimicrobia bacterium]|nr:ornithine cyclodeaminase family protein [Candidatus Neomarinimicrobiota bacterium]